ncbi:MAG: hypothetical protein HYX78_15875 [Armatimonadetes bacterium]|nr:hypothetical protein [Armatimonadota bacterium]
MDFSRTTQRRLTEHSTKVIRAVREAREIEDEVRTDRDGELLPENSEERSYHHRLLRR